MPPITTLTPLAHSGNLLAAEMARSSHSKKQPKSTASIVAKASKKSSEDQIQRALEFLDSQDPDGAGDTNISLNRVSRKFSVSYATLRRRWLGGKSRKDAHIAQLLLTPTQEDTLVQWIVDMGRRGVPLAYRGIREKASYISGQPVGKTWVYRFAKRHPEITQRWTKSMESSRAQALNKVTVTGFYDILDDVQTMHDIPPKNIWNADEKGIQLGVGERIRAFVSSNQKEAFKIEDGSRELVTMIEAICADGSTLPPCAIFKGKRLQSNWIKENPGQFSIACSENGWTDNELGLLWLVKDFIPKANALKEPGRPILLILDGHNSHCSFKFLKAAADNGIEIICLPPHTTHALQPCDVGAFGPLASNWKAQVSQVFELGQAVEKEDVLAMYHRARSDAFQESTILAAWRKTGIHPFNREAIPETAFEPAKNTTTVPALPMAPNTSGNEPASQSIASQVLGIEPNPILDSAHFSPSEHSSSRDQWETEPSAPSTPKSQVTSPSHSVVHIVGDQTQDAVTQAPALESLDATQIPHVPLPSPPAPELTTRGVPALPPKNASKGQLYEYSKKLHSIALSQATQIEKDHALHVLYTKENGMLRQKLYNKTKKKRGLVLSTSARHMTHEEHLVAAHEAEEAAAAKAEEKAKRKAEREQKAKDKPLREAEAKAERERKTQERAAKKQWQEMERQQKVLARAEKKQAQHLAKAAKEAEKAEKAAERAQRAAEAVKRNHRNTRSTTQAKRNDTQEIVLEMSQSALESQGEMETQVNISPMKPSQKRMRMGSGNNPGLYESEMSPQKARTHPKPLRPQPIPRLAINQGPNTQNEDVFFILNRGNSTNSEA